MVAGAAVGAAVMGSYYRSLPANCATIYRASLSYYQCGAVWYQPVYSGIDGAICGGGSPLTCFDAMTDVLVGSEEDSIGRVAAPIVTFPAPSPACAMRSAGGTLGRLRI